MSEEIDWETINEKLPYERNREQKKKRRELFKQFDPNDNGFVSLAEVSSAYNPRYRFEEGNCGGVWARFHFCWIPIPLPTSPGLIHHQPP